MRAYFCSVEFKPRLSDYDAMKYNRVLEVKYMVYRNVQFMYMYYCMYVCMYGKKGLITVEGGTCSSSS